MENYHDPPASSLDGGHPHVVCSSCSLRELCLPAGIDPREMERIDSLVNHRRKFRRGEHLYRAGAPLASLYAIRSGTMKSCVLYEDGREQVAGFHMMGDLLGMDAISAGRHMCDIVALEDCEVCEIPFSRLEQLSRELPPLQHQLHRIMSREIVRDYGVMLLLGSMKAEERLAAFLLNLSQRFATRGYSATDFNLRMTREEIGSYLGLKLETISRVLSRFHQDGLIEVHHKHLRITDAGRLRRVLGQTPTADA
ncbi:MAG: fumarate/nitrate reduction transcriptional regulator Fnr [Betaproteobacteria bacterium]|nr:fumarate/nitrate reduction transcriptional regulator Fnr [Betaproteobacteria bacterium]MDH3437706.1 fumarate/nitrate reduction transcriptional regulator Fnr [Betaproteobacteria bacterium]